jgi:hypothetical protein
VNDARRQGLNEERLKKSWPGIRPKFAAVLVDMEGKGWKPVVAENIFRTPAEQRRLVREGKSKTLSSFHTCTAEDGIPEALAMDVYDIRTPFNEPVRFFLELRSSARAHGLTTGAEFGLSRAQRARLDDVIRRRAFAEKTVVGWDGWHVQPRTEDLSLAKAKAGRRPTFTDTYGTG